MSICFALSISASKVSGYEHILWAVCMYVRPIAVFVALRTFAGWVNTFA